VEALARAAAEYRIQRAIFKQRGAEAELEKNWARKRTSFDVVAALRREKLRQVFV
jgi:hypothetical protein